MLPQRYGVFQRALGQFSPRLAALLACGSSEASQLERQVASPYFVASGPATLVAVRAEGRSREARAELNIPHVGLGLPARSRLVWLATCPSAGSARLAIWATGGRLCSRARRSSRPRPPGGPRP